MPEIAPPALYKQHFIDKADERIDLFRKLKQRFDVKNALYPGCFVQISPSFVIPRVVYVDSDRRIPVFLRDEHVTAYIESRKEYSEPAEVVFHHQSYEEDIDELPESFDLLISQYAGFVSAACGKYLKIGGVLVANDSHGDASMANIDPRFQLIAIVTRNGDRFAIKESELDQYMRTKRPVEITESILRARGRGFGFTRPAFSYVFRRIS